MRRGASPAATEANGGERCLIRHWPYDGSDGPLTGFDPTGHDAAAAWSAFDEMSGAEEADS
jgi:hypothetical protein